MEIRQVTVIGAGVMGGGIAAHIANAGVPVILADAVPGAAARALERLHKADPAPFMDPTAARLVTALDLPEALAQLGGVDWIIEAVTEDSEIKAQLYRALDGARKPGSVVSSNTSTLPFSRLISGQSEALGHDFLITHFFNPPRYMRLLELVSGPATRPDAVATITDFADRRLGNSVVTARDTPGFIANRIGAFWLLAALNAASDLGLTIEEADAVCGRPLGFPKTGVFGLLDLVGLDLLPRVTASLTSALPPTDRFQTLVRAQPLLERLIREGFVGRKGKGGFYRLDRKPDGGRVKLALDLVAGTWRPVEKAALDSLEAAKRDGLPALFQHRDRGGAYVRAVMLPTLAYAAGLVPEISDDIDAIDRALRLGYGWRHGPFELIDLLGVEAFATALHAHGLPTPPLVTEAAGRPFHRVANGRPEVLAPGGSYRAVVRPPGVLLLADIKRLTQPVERNRSAALWDLGDGVLCLEFTSKMNSLDPDVFALIDAAITRISRDRDTWKALVIHNEGENFSVGANLGMAMVLYNVALWDEIEHRIAAGQQVCLALRDAPFPVVSAPSGLALGGGCEILLHSDAVQAHAESYIGLVEVGVGVLPAWGGSKEMLMRAYARPGRPGGPMPAIAEAFEIIAKAKVSKSAAEAKRLGYLRPQDSVTMNRNRLLADAKARALALARDYQPPAPLPPLALPGPSGALALDMLVDGLRLQGKATAHDAVVLGAVARVLTGGDTDLTETVTEAALLTLERQEFMELVRTPATLERIEHILATGKPLRN